MKVEKVVKRSKLNGSYLRKEIEILCEMKDEEGFPKLIEYKTDCTGNPIEIYLQKLGSSLHKLIHKSSEIGFTIPIQTVVSLGLQMLERVQSLHNKGFLHLDIKPEHFLFETSDIESPLYLIDFGLSERMEEGNNKSKLVFKGNLSYSSISTMKCQKLSFKDDLESLIYIIGELLEGELPWKFHEDCDKKQNVKQLYSKVMNQKASKKGWKRYGAWIENALCITRKQEDPYYELRKVICKLLEL